ncbi:hypothetical protein [Rufibacter hautae]|uniref:Leucine-rich repeat domain-containing protein n=1 Tax=Rufibacter hautae TaxID=2595005 RepID=A0A5B6TEZ6_9BACT|nr:hypothetical protein [Rufibacter hautae]KAA3437792.1 hypothetical protein FOA19_10895 [Rufibacter hautae]
MLIVPEEEVYIDKEDQDGYKSIGIVTEKLDICIQKYKQENFNGIFGHPNFGFKNEDFGFIKDFKEAKRIWFWDINVSDVSGLYTLENPEYFGVMGKRPMLDFFHFASLKTLVLEWNSKDRNLQTCKNLELFNLWNHKPKEKSFINFNFPNAAKEVGLYWTNIEDLTTMNGLRGLNKISIERSRNLKSLRGLEKYSNSLESIFIDTCGKLTDYTFVLEFPNLKSATINRVKLK